MESIAAGTSSVDNGNDNAKTATITHEDNGAEAALDEMSQSIIDDVMLRLTKGLPRFELDLIVKEANECERALQEEIIMLEKESAALKAVVANATSTVNTDSPLSMEGRSDRISETGHQGKGEEKDKEAPPFQYGLGMPYATVDDVLRSEYTTVDRFITLSALLGRLFIPLPLPESHPYAITLEEANKKISKQQRYQQKRRVVERQQQLLTLQQSPYYTKRSTAERWTAMLTSVWKKISSHKTALVFRRPVNDRDAPGYSDRILFPMDLSLVRKLITSQQIQSLEDLHIKIALICHNCVKFNGGASDYGLVAKDFEAYVDDAIIAAVENATSIAQEIREPTTSPGASITYDKDGDDTATDQKNIADDVLIETQEGTSEKYSVTLNSVDNNGDALSAKVIPKEGGSDAVTSDGKDKKSIDRNPPLSTSSSTQDVEKSELHPFSSETITMDLMDPVMRKATADPSLSINNKNVPIDLKKGEGDKSLFMSATEGRKRASAESQHETSFVSNVKVKKKKKGAKNST